MTTYHIINNRAFTDTTTNETTAIALEKAMPMVAFRRKETDAMGNDHWTVARDMGCVGIFTQGIALAAVTQFPLATIASTTAEATIDTTTTITTLEVDNPLQTTQHLENLKALLHNYEHLLHKATGFCNLKLARGCLVFAGMDGNNDAHKILVDYLVRFAMHQKHIKTRETLRPTNERFAFRTWLIRMGWKGRETSKLRIGLYKGLNGNTAFCTETSKQRWLEKHSTRTTMVE